jgi:hypothetical protein
LMIMWLFGNTEQPLNMELLREKYKVKRLNDH